jgi:hypothetical protein
MLQKGDPGNRYDFLDLYIDGWVKNANASIRRCFPNKARQLSAELQNVIEVFNDADRNATSRKLNNNGYPVHDPRYHRDSSKPEMISTPGYNREWHSYDWYVKASTEVRQVDRIDPSLTFEL